MTAHAPTLHAPALSALTVALTLAACNQGSGPAPPAAPAQHAAMISPDAASWIITNSPGMPAQPSAQPGGWYFLFPSVDGVHYVVEPVSGYASTEVKLSVGVEVLSGSPLFDWRTKPDNTCGTPPASPATARLFLQRSGDDMAGTPGTTEFYRWWSNPSAFVLAPGSAELAVPFDPAKWSSVLGKFGTDNPAMFQAALKNLGSVGLTFGGGCFFGHGVFVTGGTAKFNLTGASIQ